MYMHHQHSLKCAYSSAPTWVIQRLNTNDSCGRNVETTAGSDTCHLGQLSSASLGIQALWGQFCAYNLTDTRKIITVKQCMFVTSGIWLSWGMWVSG